MAGELKMDVREKLVELLGANTCKCDYCEDCEYCKDEDACIAYLKNSMADHLIAHGVTVQEWIRLSEQKPDRDELVLVFFEGMRDTPAAIQVMYGWCIGGSAPHWMPLPQPPKGE